MNVPYIDLQTLVFQVVFQKCVQTLTNSELLFTTWTSPQMHVPQLLLRVLDVQHLIVHLFDFHTLILQLLRTAQIFVVSTVEVGAFMP